MGEAQKKLSITSDATSKTPKKTIEDRQTQELILAFCGPIGSGVSTVAKMFAEIFDNYDYEVVYIKISELIAQVGEEQGYTVEKDKMKDYGSRIQELQQAGNFLRKKFEKNILAQLAIQKIAIERAKRDNSTQDNFSQESRRIVYIIESLKHPDEVEFLRMLYGNMFYLVGVLCVESIRESRLVEGKHIDKELVTQIMERDKAEDEKYGQQTNKTTYHADFFIRNNHENVQQLEKTIKRYLDLILGVQGETPTKDEFAMYMAQSSAVRSGCISRQIGAAISNTHGEIVSTGRNDVPKAGGGLYSTEDGENDLRCMKKNESKCFNDDRKQLIRQEIEKVLTDELKNEKTATKLAAEIFTKTRIKDLIEFSRAVHAELDAIISAASRGQSLKKYILYSTTFPCHNCARHIVAAGIAKVFYIEPYEKSLAIELHSDSICLEPSESQDSTKKVVFLHFEGVAPRQYLNLFQKNDDIKRDGKLVKISPKKAKPVVPKYMDTYSAYEKKVVVNLEKLLGDSN